MAEKTDNNLARPARPSWKRWFDGTSMYGFELFMAGFGLTVAAIVIDYGLFAFFNYAYGIDGSNARQVVGEFSLWIVAAMLVWLPLALGFYLRVRGEQALSPTRSQGRLHKVLLSIFFFVNILILAGSLFAVLYSLIRMATGAADMEAMEMLVRVTLPAFLMAVLHAALLFAFTKARWASRRNFALGFGLLGLAVMAALMVASFGTVRGVAMDDKREADLTYLSGQIRSHYTSNRSLPENLQELDVDEDKLKMSLDDYSYDPQMSGRYELCTDFAIDTRENGRDYYERENDEYSLYGSFHRHSKGKECFKLRASYTTYDYRDWQKDSSNRS